MSTILHDYFYESKYPTHYTILVNDYLRQNIGGFQYISYLYDLEDLYNKIIDLLIEYYSLTMDNDHQQSCINYLNDKVSKIKDDILTLNNADAKCVETILNSPNNSYMGDYKLIAFQKRMKMETLGSIDKNLVKAEDAINQNNRRMQSIKSTLLKYYNELINTYDFDFLEKMEIDINKVDIDSLARKINIGINDRDESEYIAVETYKAVIDEIDYLIDAFKELSVLSFKELTADKAKELQLSIDKMRNQKNMIDLKRDLIEHIYFIGLSQRDKAPKFRNKRKSLSAKVMLDYASMYLTSYNKEEYQDLTTISAGHIIDTVDNTSPKGIEKQFAWRLYTPYMSKMR